jgi:protein involved in polysaccharide export with SLBB domain
MRTGYFKIAIGVPMRKMSKVFGSNALVLGALSVFVVACGFFLSAWGQQSTAYSANRSYGRSTAIDQSKSQAELEAEHMVSLSADKILSILRDEPGLLLQVKKALVRKAFDQGRVLDPNELTDDALFQLIREDDGARVIATREIEDRAYIKAKPTREELARNLPCRPETTSRTNATAKAEDDVSKDLKKVPNQEEVYWAKHEDDVDCDMTGYAPYGTAAAPYGQPYNQQGPPQQYPQQQYPQQQYGSQYPQQPYPQQQYPQQQYPPSQYGPQQPTTDYRRQTEMTQSQPTGDYFGMDTDESQMAGLQPDELPSLMSASVSGMSSGFSGKGMGMGTSGEGMSGMAMSPSLGSSLGSSFGSLLGQPSGASGLAGPNMENRVPPSLPPPYYPSVPLQPKLRHRPNPYADVPSLYDLYAQYSRRSPILERFGEDVFRNGTGNLEDLPMDMPAGPEYVVGPGDGLTINLTGGVSQRLQRVVDREGRVALPEVGAVEVSGHSLGDVQHTVQSVLRSQFRDVAADVSLSRVRTVRIYIVGDVERPGAYDVSSLSTPLNAVYTAGGPTSGGSLRIVQHFRGKELLQEVDVYDLLLHGIRSDLQGLQPGDTIRVPPLKGEVTIEGMVRRPAIYELNGEKGLAQVLELAGGVLPTGTLRHVDVERVEDHESRTMLRLDIPETDSDASVRKALEDFVVRDGDKIKITPILPYADKTVYLDGYVSRPGKFAYRDGMKVTDLIKSYKDLLPEPSTTHAEIIRLNQPDFTPVVLAFSLDDALAGKDQDLELKPFDTVRVFSKYDFQDPPVITVTGEVRDPGDHLTNGTPHLRDAVYLAGGTTPDALLTDAQVFRKTPNGKMTVISVSLANALNGNAKDNIELEAKDRVFIHRNLNKLDPPIVDIEGEVGRPGKYPLGADMSAADLVRVAGGFKRGAYTDEADLTRYEVEQGTKIVSDHVSVPIAKAMAGAPDADVRLRDGDVLTIRQITGWKDVGATIELTGEVVHPGTYGIQEGERLSSIIQRAGGFRAQAYPYGTVFEREEIRELQDKNRVALIQTVQGQEADVKLTPEQSGEDRVARQAVLEQYQATLESLQNTPPQGRLVVHISGNIQRWANTSADIQVRAGDRVHVPQKPSMVLVDGAVYNPTGIAFKPGRSAEWYLQQAGGPTTAAERKEIFVIRADGSVVGGSGGFFSGGVMSASLQPGDMVVVPRKVYSVSHVFQNTALVAQIGSAIAISAFYAKSF